MGALLHFFTLSMLNSLDSRQWCSFSAIVDIASSVGWIAVVSVVGIGISGALSIVEIAIGWITITVAVVGIGISGALAIDVAMAVAIAQTSIITEVSIRVSRALAIKIAMAIEPESVALGSKVIGSRHLLGVGVVRGHGTIRMKHQQARISLSLTLSNDHRDLDGVSALTETSLLLISSEVWGDSPG